MTIRWFFLHGPLDGLVLSSDLDESSSSVIDLAQLAYHETFSGFPGATFEAFNPLLINQEIASELALRLHLYRVTTSQAFNIRCGNSIVAVYTEIHATHVGPTNRHISIKFDRQSESESWTAIREAADGQYFNE